MLINKALLNNGYSVFRLEILEYCDKELLIDREQYYLDLLKPEYNILEFAYSNIGFKHSASTLKKMKDRIRTPEHKFKLKKHLNELNSKQFTDEFKSKLSKGTANFNRWSKGKKVNFTNIETDTNLEFSSWREAAVKLKISRNTIKKFINTSNLFKEKYLISDK